MYAKDSALWQPPFVDSGVEWSELGALPKTPPYPTQNPFSESKRQLGKQLFEDPRLSQSNQIACASCHDKELGFSNGRSVAFGHNRAMGKRNVQSVVMSAFGEERFWDGRAKDLESQVAFPIADKKEMAFSIEQAARKLSDIKAYRAAFKAAFGDSIITPKRISQAIATYERSLMPRTSRFDRFMRENEAYRSKGEAKISNTLDDKEIVGLHLFRTKARCMNCHHGITFSDNKYHNLGLSFYGRKGEDLGRYEVSKNPNDSGKFKTPSLREVRKSAPYMHMGTFPTLAGVLAAYNFGMPHFTPKTPQEKADILFPKTDELLKALHLTQSELEALEAFLRAI